MERVYFVTNRKPNRKQNPDDFGTEFSDHGLANLRYGFADIEGDDPDDYAISVAAESWKPDYEKGGLLRKPTLGSDEIMSALREDMAQNGRDTLIYVHGYNVSFKEALTTGAQLKRNLSDHGDGAGLNVAVFSWPSNGSAMPYLAYGSDRDESKASGPAFARAFLKLTDFLRGASPEEECDQSVHLMAHSMGNYLLRHAVQEIRAHYPDRPPRLFDEIFMMAADEDDDALEHDHKLRLLPRTARRVNLYFNRGDVALHTSDKTKGNPDRLGTDGPRLPHQTPAKVVQIDCTPVVRGLVEHGYHVGSERLTKDLLAALADVDADLVPGRSYVSDSNRYRLGAEPD